MRREGSWWWLLLGGGVFILLSFAGGMNGLLGAGLLINVLTVPAIGRGLRRHRPADPVPWRLLQIAMGLLLLSNLLQMPATPVFDALADLAGAVGYAFDIAALWRMGVARSYRKDPTNLIDALIAAGGVGVITWLCLIVPYLSNPSPSVADKATAMVFSLLSLTGLTCTIRLAIGPGARNPALYLLTVAACSAIAAETTLSVGVTGDPMLGWQLPAAVLISVTGFLCIVAASWHPAMRELAVPTDEPVPTMTNRRLAMMTLAVLIAPVVLLIESSHDTPWTVPGVVVCWMFVSALVMFRLAGLVRARSRAAAYDTELAAVAEQLLAADDADLPAITEVSAGRLLAMGAGTDLPAPRAWMFTADDGPSNIPVQLLAALESGRVCVAVDPAPFLPDAPAGTRVLLAPLVVGRSLSGLVAAPMGPDDDEPAAQALGRLAREAALAMERSTLIAETERRAGERRFKALVEQSKDVVLQLDAHDRICFATPASREVFGMSDEAIVGRDLRSLVEADHVEVLVRFLSESRRAAAGPPIELRFRHAQLGPLWCELVATDLSDEPMVWSLVVTVRAIDDRKMAEQRLARSEARFRSLVQHSSDVVAVVDTDFVVGYASPSISRLLGHPHEDIVDCDFLQLVHPDDRAALVELSERLDPTGDLPGRLEVRVRDDQEAWRTLEVTASDLRAHPAVQGIVLNAHDVSERKELELDLARQAMFDDLTGLANRLRFRQKLGEALQRSADVRTFVAVLFLDLNEFKTINDSMGHAVGDDLLAIVGRRLAGITRSTDTAARLGGDEFALLVVSEDEQDALHVAHRVQTSLSAPIAVGGREVTVSGSIGIAYAEGPGAPIGDLLRNADTAMYVAKRGGSRSQVQVFDSSMLTSVRERLDLMNDLGRALDRDELVLHYQPVVDLATGQVKGFEALTRWQHPTRGMVAPGSFVPLAEEIGLILPMTEWVLDEALRQLAVWNEGRPTVARLSMSVNMSGRQIEVDGAAAMVEHALLRHGIEPGLVVVELTEGLEIDVNSPDVRRRLEAVTNLGVQLAADDFGAGFASYANLQRLPYSVVKIDRSVISGLDNAHEERARLQIRSIIEMAHGAGMTVVAEGIEGAEQLQVLRELGCDTGQGYYFARPLPAGQAMARSFDVRCAA